MRSSSLPTLTLLAVLAAIGGPARAADEPTAREPAGDAADASPAALSVDAAVARALERHPALKAAAFAQAGAAARVEQAHTAWLPRVGVEAGYRYSGPVPELVVDTGITPPGATEPMVIRREAGTEHGAHGA
jgi:hypothetical protein